MCRASDMLLYAGMVVALFHAVHSRELQSITADAFYDLKQRLQFCHNTTVYVLDYSSLHIIGIGGSGRKLCQGMVYVHKSDVAEIEKNMKQICEVSGAKIQISEDPLDRVEAEEMEGGKVAVRIDGDYNQTSLAMDEVVKRVRKRVPVCSFYPPDFMNEDYIRKLVSLYH